VPLAPLGDPAERRFQVVGGRAYAVGTREADHLRRLAESGVAAPPPAEGLALTVRPMASVFPVKGPKVIEVRLTNNGAASATYVQKPIAEVGGKLYLTGPGRIHIRTTSGELVPDRGNVVTGMAPPPPPQPALILPRAGYVENIDLDKYFDLPPGRYTFSMFLAAPDGRSRVASNGFSFQVGAVNLPEEPEPSEVAKPAPEAPRRAPSVGAAAGPEAAGQATSLPDPASYQPGEAAFGLAALLRPTKAEYTLGEPVTVEFRLINTGPRTVAVDTRLERTLAIKVEPVGESPQPLMIRQVIPWPADQAVPPPQRAYLREGAFWGRTIDLNTLYGKRLDAIEAPSPQEIARGKDLRYERFGRDLFGFTKPGTYRITATYTVSRPKQGGAAGDQSQWWTGDVRSNTIAIRIAPKGRGP